jgi:hypothetical protein
VRYFIYCGRGMHGGKYGQGGLLEDGRNIGLLFRYTNGRCLHMQLVKYITLLLLIPSLCWAVEPIDFARMNVGIVGAGGAAGEPAWSGDFQEAFTAATPTYTWTGTGGTWTSGSTTTKVWAASPSLAIANTVSERYTTISAQDEVNYTWIWRASAGSGSNLMGGVHDGSASQGYIQLTGWSTDHWTGYTLYFAGTSTSVTKTINLNTTYYIRVHYKRKGGGSNSTHEVWFVTDQPTTAATWGAADYSNIVSYTNDTTITRLYLASDAATGVIDEARAYYSASIPYYDN